VRAMSETTSSINAGRSFMAPDGSERPVGRLGRFGPKDVSVIP
jgi:hypothetical protein